MGRVGLAPACQLPRTVALGWGRRLLTSRGPEGKVHRCDPWAVLGPGCTEGRSYPFPKAYWVPGFICIISFNPQEHLSQVGGSPCTGEQTVAQRGSHTVGQRHGQDGNSGLANSWVPCFEL